MCNVGTAGFVLRFLWCRQLGMADSFPNRKVSLAVSSRKKKEEEEERRRKEEEEEERRRKEEEEQERRRTRRTRTRRTLHERL